MLRKKKILFCDINPTCYAISQQKEICKRHLKNLAENIKYAKIKEERKFPILISSHSSNLIKRGKGIDLRLQENKAVNIMLAANRINGTIIRPGEQFSFWKIAGKSTKKKGYKEGRVLIGGKLRPGIGGGLCNLANTIHLLILHSPLEVTEFHAHSDALAPDEGKRVPFSSGTSVNYNYIDYRFKNTTDQNIQLCVWCENDKLYGELRGEKEFPYKYRLEEENHHFHKEGDKFFRISKIYKITMDKRSGEIVEKKLVRDNHSEVMYDYSQIPKDQIQ